MPNYEPYHIIAERHKDDPEFTKWLEQLKEEYHEVYPHTYLSLDEKFLVKAFEEGMSPHQTLSENHYD